MKRFIALLICLGMLFSIVGCGQQTEAPVDEKEPETVPEAKLTPGTYTATANGHNGPVTVETVVDETSIKSVKIIEHFETQGVWQVIDEVP